ncbi:hypothetical protein HK405_010682, partial [Cladochytrium tenue]
VGFVGIVVIVLSIHVRRLRNRLAIGASSKHKEPLYLRLTLFEWSIVLATACIFAFAIGVAAALRDTTSVFYMSFLAINNFFFYTALVVYLASIFVPLQSLETKLGVLVRNLWTLLVLPAILIIVRMCRAYLEDLSLTLTQENLNYKPVVRALSIVVICYDAVFLLSAVQFTVFILVCRIMFTRALRITVGPSVLASRRQREEDQFDFSSSSASVALVAPDFEQFRLAYGIPISSRTPSEAGSPPRVPAASLSRPSSSVSMQQKMSARGSNSNSSAVFGDNSTAATGSLSPQGAASPHFSLLLSSTPIQSRPPSTSDPTPSASNSSVLTHLNAVSALSGGAGVGSVFQIPEERPSDYPPIASPANFSGGVVEMKALQYTANHPEIASLDDSGTRLVEVEFFRPVGQKRQPSQSSSKRPTTVDFEPTTHLVPRKRTVPPQPLVAIPALDFPATAVPSSFSSPSSALTTPIASTAAAEERIEYGIRVGGLRSARDLMGWIVLLYSLAALTSIGVSVPTWISNQDAQTVFLLNTVSSWVDYICVLLGISGAFFYEIARMWRERRALLSWSR